MNLNFEQLKIQFQQDLDLSNDAQSVEDLRIKYLGRKGLVQSLYSQLASLPNDQKPIFGKVINEFRQIVNQGLDDKKSSLGDSDAASKQQLMDLTLPGYRHENGHKHLLTQTIEEICDIFKQLGFVIEDGPEIESEFNNFAALNIPADHPSRDGFDTFYLDRKGAEHDGTLLRSHTSPGQIRIMQKYAPPLAVIIPGKVYRPDAVDASHSFMFHQIEGLLVDEEVRFSDLKGLLTTFCKRLFGNEIDMRFRPHFFPFTEPSAEVDISWSKGKRNWLEIMGCGMVHPNVFSAVGYKRGAYSGLAFGLGVERIAMLKYGINDIRVFYENDLRFLKQF
ncbi:MAG: phenylalanine--tRNA ligase subunit alpha [Candidatus Omnitrophica bacterium]|nr:phenylalanine--tRNA ligase subunit alpha [Candidatus Omnitrophota bacterium]